MYPNLEAEIVRHGIKKIEIARAIGKTYGTVSQKLRGKYPLTWDEATVIQECFFADLDIKYLFATSGKRSQRSA